MERWQQLSLREQRIVLAGACFAILLLGYWLIWLPLTETVEALKNNVAEQQTLHQWLKRSIPEIQHLRHQQLPTINRVTINSTSLLATIDESLKQNSLAGFVNEINQTQPNQVRIRLNTIGFDDLIQWLTLLWKTYSIRVVDADITPTPITGEVGAVIVLSV